MSDSSLDLSAVSSLPELFFTVASRRPEAPFLWHKVDDTWHCLRWAEVTVRVRRLTRALETIGITPGARVMLVSENRPEWCISDLAIMNTGALVVPAYVSNTARDHAHILRDSMARVAIVSTVALLKTVLQGLHACVDENALSHIIVMASADALATVQSPVPLMSFDALLQDTQEGDAALRETSHSSSIRRQDTAVIIYTSGTGGSPKGVMLSHGAILHNCRCAGVVLSEIMDGTSEAFLSFLPLSHAYEHTAGQFLPISLGAEIYYAEGADKLAVNMAEVHPTLILAVPRLYELMSQRIVMALSHQSRFKRFLFYQAVEWGRRALAGRIGLMGRVYNRVLDVLVRRKVQARFGGRLKAFVSGGAPLNPDTGSFFMALGVRVLQGYGLSEAGPVISTNRPSDPSVLTVGPPLPGVEVRLADDGEILCRGENVMNGYWQREADTRAAIVDGWLHTGDIGTFNEDGHLIITDRKKNIIVNTGGDNIAPQRVEGVLESCPEIAQAMVAGDKRPYLVAVIVPDATIFPADCERDVVKQTIHATITQLQRDLAIHERVRRFILADEPFSIENGEMTPTLKNRRPMIMARYEERLNALYEGG